MNLRLAILLSMFALMTVVPTRASTDPATATLEAAQAGDAEAQYMLARQYERGDGVPADDFEAVRWLQRAAAQDHPGAMLDLGWMLANGYGTAKDPEMAFLWFARAAALDVAGAADQRDAVGEVLTADRRLSLQQRALKGLAVSVPSDEQNTDQAIDPVSPPPMLDPGDSVESLRPRLMGGQSIRAFQKLGLLAQRGDVLARNLYGLALRRSTDETDRRQGLQWLMLAAQDGLPAAQYNVAGAMLEDGTPLDFQAIAVWLDLAYRGSRPADPTDYTGIAAEFAARASIQDPYRAALEGSVGAYPELRELITMRRQEMIARREMEQFRTRNSGGAGGITTTVIE